MKKTLFRLLAIAILIMLLNGFHTFAMGWKEGTYKSEDDQTITITSVGKDGLMVDLLIVDDNNEWYDLDDMCFEYSTAEYTDNEIAECDLGKNGYYTIELCDEYLRFTGFTGNEFEVVGEFYPEETKEALMSDNVYTSNTTNLSLKEIKADVDKYIQENTDFRSMYEWEYPNTFKTERDKIFKLYKEVYQLYLENESYNHGVTPPQALDVKIEKDVVIGSLKRESYTYFGDVKNNRPDGWGIILNGGPYFYYGGQFKNGKPSGYGIYAGDIGAPISVFSWESSKPVLKNGKFIAEGKGIIYYKSDNSDARGRLFEVLSEDISDYFDDLTSDYDYDELIVYPGQIKSLPYYKAEQLSLKPCVHYEGDLKNGEANGKGKMYYDYYRNTLKKNELLQNPSLTKDSFERIGDKGAYGHLYYEGEFKNGKRTGKGKQYYFNGSLQYEGEFKDSKYHGKGTLYDEDGTIRHKGKFKDGNIA